VDVRPDHGSSLPGTERVAPAAEVDHQHREPELDPA
jgi:hypothetical protein